MEVGTKMCLCLSPQGVFGQASCVFVWCVRVRAFWVFGVPQMMQGRKTYLAGCNAARLGRKVGR